MTDVCPEASEKADSSKQARVFLGDVSPLDICRTSSRKETSPHGSQQGRGDRHRERFATEENPSLDQDELLKALRAEPRSLGQMVTAKDCVNRALKHLEALSMQPHE